MLIYMTNLYLFYGEELLRGWCIAHYGILPGATLKMVNVNQYDKAYFFRVEVKTLLGKTKATRVTIWHTIEYLTNWLEMASPRSRLN